MPRPPKLLSAAEALSLFREYNRAAPEEQEAIESGPGFQVGEDVVLEDGTPSLPPNVEFLRALDARGSSLSTFDNPVQGSTDFEGVGSLLHIGPNARFGSNLHAEKTSLSIFSSPVAGTAYLRAIPTLREIDSLAKFGGLVIKGSPITHFDAAVAEDANFKALQSLVEIGPHSLFGGKLLIDESTVASLGEDMLTILESGRGKPGILVAVSEKISYWGHIAASPPIPKEIGEALRLAAACTGPVVLCGRFGGVDAVRFYPETALYLDGSLENESLEERRRACDGIVPYYEAALADLAGTPTALPSDPGSVCASREADFVRR